MKIPGALFSPVALSLLAVLAGGAVWSGDALAQTVAWTTALVPINGTVSGQPESVLFTGQAQVNSRLAPDPDFNQPSLVMSIDLRALSGVGSSTKTKYVIAGPENVQKKVAASHRVEFTFPFYKSGTDGSLAQSGVASFALGFDPNTGAVTSASGNVTSASFPQ
jgi:hypothetical protein